MNQVQIITQQPQTRIGTRASQLPSDNADFFGDKEAGVGYDPGKLMLVVLKVRS
jgi:hypothetical protein